MLREEPLSAARALADDLGAELVIGGELTEVLVGRLSALAGRGPRLDLEALEAAADRATYTQQRTREAAAAKLSRTLNTALAIHPDTLRRSATELIEARARKARATQKVLPSTSARLRTTACCVVALSGVALIGLGSLVGGIGVIVIWLLLALCSSLFERRRIGEARTPLHDATAAEELSQRRWEQLVGTGPTPADVESVVSRFDPQHDVVSDLIAHNPAVRAADELAARRRKDLDEATQLLTDRAAGATVGALVSTTVVACPYDGLSEQRCRLLHRRLLALPSNLRVIMVLAPGPSTDDGRILDLTDGPMVSSRTDVQTSP